MEETHDEITAASLVERIWKYFTDKIVSYYKEQLLHCSKGSDLLKDDNNPDKDIFCKLADSLLEGCQAFTSSEVLYHLFVNVLYVNAPTYSVHVGRKCIRTSKSIVVYFTSH